VSAARREPLRFPQEGWKADLTPGQVRQVACPLCGVAAGDPCNYSHYPVPVLWMAFHGHTGHTARYISRLQQEDGLAKPAT
jgi:hypothetical protein